MSGEAVKIKKQFEYMILSDSNETTLAKSVGYYLSKGWKCQGGVSAVMLENEFCWFAQAMIFEYEVSE